MPNLEFIEKEFKLRKLYAALVRKKGCEKEAFDSDLFNLFSITRTFSLREVKNFWNEHVEKTKDEDNFYSLYIHIPFCRSRCVYCQHYKSFYQKESQLDAYVQSVLKEIQLFMDISRRIHFKNLYFGGGTPSLLTEKQLKNIFTEINNSFSFARQTVRTFEYNPYDTSPSKMKILADFGINRISIGVQSLDGEVLRHANRSYQNYDLIRETVRDVRSATGIERINADLMIGLWNDSPQTVIESFIKLAEINVDSICLFPLKPMPHYIKRYYNNMKNLFDRQLANKLRNFEKLVVPVAKKFEYDFVPLDHSVLNKDSWDFVLKKKSLSRLKKIFYTFNDDPHNVMGIGAGSWSMLTNTVCYTKKDVLFCSEGQKKKGDGYKGILLNDKRGKYWYVLQRLGDINRISIPSYNKCFGTDICDDFKGPLDSLKKLGVITITKKVIFLRAMDPCDKFAYLLFFVDSKTILAELSKTIANRDVAS